MLNSPHIDFAVEFRNVVKTFYDGKFVANDNISFGVKPGTIHVIAGENGAGKSVLLSMLFGLSSPDRGDILINGHTVKFVSAAQAMQHGLGMVQQHFQLIDRFSVGENVLLGSERILTSKYQTIRIIHKILKNFRKKILSSKDRKGCVQSHAEMLNEAVKNYLLSPDLSADRIKTVQAQSQLMVKEFAATFSPTGFTDAQFHLKWRNFVDKYKKQNFGIAFATAGSQRWIFNHFEPAYQRINLLAKQYGFGISAKQRISALTVGQEQKTEILKLLFRDAKIMIFDEPTAMLTPSEIKELIKILLNFKAHGKTIIIVTHKLDEIKALADMVTVLRRGQLIGTIPAKGLTAEVLSKMIVGHDIEPIVKEVQPFGRDVLIVKNLSVKEHRVLKLKNVSFAVKEGEILALAGVEGNGQSEIANALVGLVKPESGIVTFQGDKRTTDWTHATPKHRIDDGLAFIPEDRQRQGLVLDMRVYENLGLKNFSKRPYSSYGIIHFRNMRRHALKLIKDYDVRGSSHGEAQMRSLSGGNQQKAILARELTTKSKFLLVFQATRGLDVGAINFVHQQILAARRQKRAILLISYDINEIMDLADRVLVINSGKLTGELTGKDINATKIGILMSQGQEGQHGTV